MDQSLNSIVGNLVNSLGGGLGQGIDIQAAAGGPTFVNNLANQQLNQVIQDSIDQFMNSGMASDGTPATA